MANVILWTSIADHPGIIRSAGAYSIKSWLQHNGYSVKVVDFCSKLTVDEIVKITDRFLNNDTIAIGISTTFFNSDTLRKVVEARKRIEETNKKVKWVAGGYYAGIGRVKELANWIEFKGIGEDTFLKWLDEHRPSSVIRQEFDITSCRQLLDESDIVLPGEALPIELGRGCKFKCKFCQYPLIGKKPGTYIRNLDYVKEEMLSNFDKWGVTNYYFIDDTVNEDDWKMQKIADIAQTLPFKLQWVGYQRADLIYSHPYQAQWIKDSGCIGTFFGLESLHPESSKIVGKGWSGVHARDFIPKLIDVVWKKEIGIQLGFIAGLPEESPDNLVTTQQWCIDSDVDEWQFKPLGIVRSSLVWQSEFDRNYGLYGYKFSDDKTYNWTNKFWSFLEAEQFAEDLNKKATVHRRPGCWSRNSMYTSVGRTFVRETYNDINKEDMQNRVEGLIREYVKRSLEYPQY